MRRSLTIPAWRWKRNSAHREGKHTLLFFPHQTSRPVCSPPQEQNGIKLIQSRGLPGLWESVSKPHMWRCIAQSRWITKKTLEISIHHVTNGLRAHHGALWASSNLKQSISRDEDTWSQTRSRAKRKGMVKICVVLSPSDVPESNWWALHYAEASTNNIKEKIGPIKSQRKQKDMFECKTGTMKLQEPKWWPEMKTERNQLCCRIHKQTISKSSYVQSNLNASRYLRIPDRSNHVPRDRMKAGKFCRLV